MNAVPGMTSKILLRNLAKMG